MTVRFYFSEAYVPPDAAFDTFTKAADVAALVTDVAEIVAPRPLTADDIARVHDLSYVEAVRTGEPSSLAASAGVAWSGGRPWSPTLFPAVAASAGGAVAAAVHALATGDNAGSASSGLHHARRSHGAGFCTFNGLALATRAAKDAGAQGILIVDLDAHCGGGTASLVGGLEGVRCLDVAVSAFDLYAPPPGWTLDLVARSEEYLPTIERRLGDLGPGPMDLVLYNAGMDPHGDCAVGGLPGIDAATIECREEMVFAWAAARGVPVAFVLAGGYAGTSLTRDALARLHALTVEAAARPR
jgi:acetoin utilization deacetylase AcuC-like enzyme